MINKAKIKWLNILFYFVIFIANLNVEKLYGKDDQLESSRIIELVEKTKIRGFEDIAFYCRMPNNKKAFTGLGDSSVRGVLALCTWNTKAEDVRQNVSSDGRFRKMVNFADENNLALVSWTNFKGYNVFVDTEGLSEAQREKYERNYGVRVKEWKNGFKRLCRKVGIPDDNILIYGISGGGQMAHRLVLREPEMFTAIHIHINSSYDLPTRKGKEVLWLVTTGEVEHGYKSAINFYRSSLELGYHMIFKAGENLGHSNSPQIQALGLEFFKYCLKFGDFAEVDVAKDLSHFELMKYPAYVGDLRNQYAFETSHAEKFIDKKDMVALPTQDIADAWGVIVEK